MIDEASGQVLARFVEENSTTENLDLLGAYLRRFGRPGRVRTHRMSLFRGNPRAEDTPAGAELTAGRSQIRRALEELDVEWSPTDLESTPGFASDFFKTAKRELARRLRATGARTLREANRYLDQEYLPAWRHRHVANVPNAHRPLRADHDLDAILSEVETRTVSEAGRVRFYGADYLLPASERLAAIGAQVLLENRRNGAVYLRTEGGRFPLTQCDPEPRSLTEIKIRKPVSKPRAPRRHNRAWMQNFFKQPEPPLWRSLK